MPVQDENDRSAGRRDKDSQQRRNTCNGSGCGECDFRHGASAGTYGQAEPAPCWVRVLAAHQDDWLCRVVQTWASQGGCWLAVWQVKHGVLWTYRRDGWSIQNPPVSGKGQKRRRAHFLRRCFHLTAYALCSCCRTSALVSCRMRTRATAVLCTETAERPGAGRFGAGQRGLPAGGRRLPTQKQRGNLAEQKTGKSASRRCL